MDASFKQESHFPENWLWWLCELLMVFSTKVNLLYLFYLTELWCCFLHLIKQNCLLKTFLRTHTLVIQASLYLLSPLGLIWNCVTSKWLKSNHQIWLFKDIWSWLYSSDGSEELWAWTFIHTSWNLQKVSEGILFSRLLKTALPVPVFKYVGEKRFFMWLKKYLRKL